MIKRLPGLIIFICCLHLSSEAQKGSNFLSIGPSIGIPVNFSIDNKPGVGAGFRGYFGVTPLGSILGNVNLINFPYKNEGSLTITSLKIGYATRFNAPGLFLYGDGGIIIQPYYSDENQVNVEFGFGLGYSIPVRNGAFVDIVSSYNFVIDAVRSWVDIHIAYRFTTANKKR
jgi:hypothetical protein